MKVRIKYFTEDMPEIQKIDNGDWIDLRAAKTIKLKKGDYCLIPLGVGMKLPYGYEAHLVPRSSTFKNYGIIQTNSCGIIDNSYSGNDDQWMMPVYATRDTVINKHDRVCQFRIINRQPSLEFETTTKLDEISRSGFGSTGKQ